MDELQLKVTNVIASGDQASVELKADGVCNNGLYHSFKLVIDMY